MPSEIQAVCSLFGCVFMTDASSAPLVEIRSYPTPSIDRSLQPRHGAAMAALGLFNIPLTPYVLVPEENGPNTMQFISWVMRHCVTVDARLLPVGYVDDNAEHMWGLSVDMLERFLRPLVLAGTVQINREENKIEGFYRGIDVIHVLWRLAIALYSGSHDFLMAGLTLRTLMSRCFNPIYDSAEEVTDSDSCSDECRSRRQGDFDDIKIIQIR